MTDPLTLTAIYALLAKNVPAWLNVLEGTLLDKEKSLVVDQGTNFLRRILHLDERKQLRHLERALKSAVDKGLSSFHTSDERDQYQSILTILFESGIHIVTLRREALRLFTLSEKPNLTELNEVFNRSLRFRSLSQPTPPTEVDAAPYLVSFFNALVAVLYADPFFKQALSDVFQARAALATLRIEQTLTDTQQSTTEAVSTLRQIYGVITNDYTEKHYQKDMATYTAFIERTLHNLKIVGVASRERGEKAIDPELNGIFVPIRVALRDQSPSETDKLDSLIDLLERFPSVVLLGGPGSGKSTAIRHLAWSHAAANQPNAIADNLPLLSGKPLPLRIELRRFIEDRKQHPDYSFISYATEVILGREAIKVDSRMFEKMLEGKAMLVLFDGLDEVGTLAERQRLVEDIEHFALLYPGNRILVTSRPVGYELASCSKQLFMHARVQDFNDEQILEFLKRWYTHVLRLSPIPHDEQQELETLFKTLKDNSRLHKLAENPLLLTVITALYRSERLPDRRAQVYDRCAELLLETWAKLKGTNVRWQEIKMSKDDQGACVAHLGFELHTRSQERENSTKTNRVIISEENTASDVSSRLMLQEIEHFLSSRNLMTEAVERHAEAKLFFELVRVEAELIVERGKDENGEDLYGFVHRTFQEYFAAVDVFERYQQDEDPTIISAFLQEHLHDPHWREVILLLLGKLKRKPATAQLRQILEGKIRSRRSDFNDIVQQDLFFICDCLVEEIAVEPELAEKVISRLSHLIKNSPFRPQCREAIEYLGRLMQTRQYAILGKEQLKKFAAQGLNIKTRIDAIEVFYLNTTAQSEERQMLSQAAMSLVQDSNLSAEQALEIAAATPIRIGSANEINVLVGKMYLALMKRTDLSSNDYIDAIIQSAECFSLFSADILERAQSIQMLLDLTQRSDLSVKQAIRAARILYRTDQNKQLATQVLLKYTQCDNTPVEQLIAIAEVLYRFSTEGSIEEQHAAQIILNLSQTTGSSIQQAIKAIGRSYLGGTKPFIKILAPLLKNFIQNPDTPIEQTIEAARVLYYHSLLESERQFAIQALEALLRRSDISTEQTIQAARTLALRRDISKEESLEHRWATEILLVIAQQPDLSFEQHIQVAEALYGVNSSTLKEKKEAIQIFSALIKQTDLSFEQWLQVAKVLYKCLVGSQSSFEDFEFLGWIFLDLAQDPHFTLEQHLQALKIPFTVFNNDYRSQALAVRMVLKLLKEEEVKEYLARFEKDAIPNFV